MNKTLKEIIAIADELNPNSYSNNIKAQWVNEVEAYIQTEIYNVAPLDVVSYADYEESKDKELSLDAVNDKIYLTYLQAMIDFSNKEYQAFNNDIALYNTYIDTYAKWYVRTHGEGEKLISGMYLSAYGIAVKHGFNGSEEEWLLSLKGEKGDTGHGLEIKGVASNFGELPASASIGDIWMIPVEVAGEPNEWGISEAYQTAELYIWNGTEWQSIGSFKGEQGPQGYPGATGEKGEDGVGIDNVYTLPYEGGRGVVLQLSNGLVYSFDVNDGYTPQKGVDYWTEEDKEEIISEIPSGGTWTTLADITLTEEVNSVICVDSNSFPDIAKVGDFHMNIEIPKHETKQNGNMQIKLNNLYVFGCIGSFDTNYNYLVRWSGYSINIPNVNRFNLIPHQLMANTTSTSLNVITTCSILNVPLDKIHIDITSGGVLPIGTKIKIVGCVK